jgi:hypothetical protein
LRLNELNAEIPDTKGSFSKLYKKQYIAITASDTPAQTPGSPGAKETRADHDTRRYPHFALLNAEVNLKGLTLPSQRSKIKQGRAKKFIE